MSDTYKRHAVSKDVMQCGCHWKREPGFGDVLVLCPIHKAHSDASVKKFERERSAPRRLPVREEK
jgi:hypothetical protein